MEPIETRSDSRRTLIAASPAQVFAAMSDPVRVARWWGPNGFTSTIHALEFRPGGSWRRAFHAPRFLSAPLPRTPARAAG
ncbi:MAG: SRPBCC domain-containing protein [Burkholderiales bacterium]|nr:SRPBCC domain-containing protein [Burkholderiales bacterium]